MTTWMQKEPRQCPCVGWTLKRATRMDPPNHRSPLVVRETKRAMRKSDVPFATELFSGMPPLESEQALLSPTNKKSQKGSELLQYVTSAVHTFMEYQFDEYLWSSWTRRRKGSHVKVDPIKSTSACGRSVCMAQWMRVLVGRHITRRS